MQIYDNRKREDLIQMPNGKIVKLEGCREAGSVSVILSEGYTIIIDYSEIEALFNAMDGYTGELEWRKRELIAGDYVDMKSESSKKED